MNMSSESLLVILFVGLIAGWLAGQIVRGTGFGIIGDLLVGIVGAFIGSWLLPQLGIHLGTGVISAIVNATIGAILLLLVVRLRDDPVVSIFSFPRSKMPGRLRTLSSTRFENLSLCSIRIFVSLPRADPSI